MAEHSKFQQKIIRNYYQNREAIALQRVQELITELYLAEGKKRERHWQTIIGHLEALGVKQPEIDRLVREDKPEGVANLIKKWMK